MGYIGACRLEAEVVLGKSVVSAWQWGQDDKHLERCGVEVETPTGIYTRTYPIKGSGDPVVFLNQVAKEVCVECGVEGFCGFGEWEDSQDEPDTSRLWTKTMGVGDKSYLVGEIQEEGGKASGRLYLLTKGRRESTHDLYHVFDKDTVRGVKTALARKAAEVVTTVHGLRSQGLTEERIELTSYKWDEVMTTPSSSKLLFSGRVPTDEGDEAEINISTITGLHCCGGLTIEIGEHRYTYGSVRETIGEAEDDLLNAMTMLCENLGVDFPENIAWNCSRGVPSSAKDLQSES